MSSICTFGLCVRMSLISMSICLVRASLEVLPNASFVPRLMMTKSGESRLSTYPILPMALYWANVAPLLPMAWYRIPLLVDWSSNPYMLPLGALTVIEQAVVGEESVAVAVSLPSVVSKSMRLPLTDMSDMDISLRPYTMILSKGC